MNSTDTDGSIAVKKLNWKLMFTGYQIINNQNSRLNIIK